MGNEAQTIIVAAHVILKKIFYANSIKMINQAFDNFFLAKSKLCMHMSLTQTKIDKNLLTTNVISQTH